MPRRGGIAGYVLFGETIDGPTLTGALIIVGSTLYIARREAAVMRRPHPAAGP